MEQNFELTIGNKIHNFSLDNHGTVWLIEKDGSKTNKGQEIIARNIEEAREIARIMIYAIWKVKK